MTGKAWWGGLVAALALGLVGPSVASESDDSTEAEGASMGSEAMYEFLVAEIAAQRGDTEGALSIFHRLARELKDPQIARRAVEAAIRARAFGPALESATLLLELDPESTLAREIMAALLANEGDLLKAREMLGRVLEKTANRGPILLQLSHLLGKFPDKAAVLEATRTVTAPYDMLPEAHYAVGVAALIAGNVELAMSESEAALSRNPSWEQGAILKAQILRKSAPAEVIGFYQDFVSANPASQEARMQLGRELAADRRLAEAREQFREVEKRARTDSQASYAIGLLSLQLEDFSEAQLAFTRALKQGYRDPTSIYLGMGQASEGLKRYEEAISWYQKVEAGDWVRAQLKIATLIARQQGLVAGREYLHRIEARTPEDSIQMIQVEAQLLRDAKAWNDTYEMLSKAVARFPDSFELLYDRAMAAERIDRLDVLEADLRRVIKMKPDYAHAYNALGYTLAEKTNRLAEAKELIEKAHKLSPDDPFIVDSLGWVNYRMGLVQEALKHLQSAYNVRPDPEIAAHLGEVLWRSGQRDEAQKIWRAALAENPNHETLNAVMQKFRPSTIAAEPATAR
jgi:tetratricopeptide (TPR) repeat protein